jgi:methylthioxylose transferase
MPTSDVGPRRALAPWVGLLVTVGLVATAILWPMLTGWDTATRRDDHDQFPPLHGFWLPGVGRGTGPAIAIALVTWWLAAEWAQRLPWRRLLLASYVVGLAWLLALAYVDGPSGIERSLGNPYEYLETAREVASDEQGVGAMLDGFVDRIPRDAEDNWVTHVAGHPPGALLFFVGLVRLGLGGDWEAGMVVTAIAASTACAVLVTLRALGAEEHARRAAPFLVLTPAAVFMAVSADAMFAAVAAWGLAALAVAATGPTRTRTAVWSVVAGLFLGGCVLLSYGLPLLGLLAVAVLWAARSWTPLPIAAAAALAVVLGFAVAGFAWWEAFPVLRERYWDGVASERPMTYWWWGNLAALAICAGPLVGAGLAMLRRSTDHTVLLLVGAAVLTVVLADASQMSKSEVERIWLPFVPWLTVSVALLPERWRRWGFGLQVGTALVVQHLLYTSW